MTTAPSLKGSGITSLPTMDHATKSDGLAATSDGEVAGSDDIAEADLSVPGDEGPGAALLLIGSGTDQPEARWSPWPREASA
jgi:hypothetical protein